MLGAPIETRLLNFKTAYFDPFDRFDRYLGGVDLDEIMSRAVKCNRQVCDYHSVEDYCLQHKSPMGRNTRLSIVCMILEAFHEISRSSAWTSIYRAALY